MKRSEINGAVRAATACFTRHGWTLPPNPHWDVTDFGLDDFERYGLVLVNLAEEPEYCEKLMVAVRDQRTPAHCHKKKKEDIIARAGSLAVQVWGGVPGESQRAVAISVNREPRTVAQGTVLTLAAGERVTLVPGVYHEFWPLGETCVIGEVSTANDDIGDNFFVDPAVGRYTAIDEDEPALVRLVSDR
jgi:D-lyxose ketol-isomerase